MWQKTALALASVLLSACTAQPEKNISTVFTDCEGNFLQGVNTRDIKMCKARAPIYPANAQRSGIEGVCVTTFDVGIDGLIHNPSVQCQPLGYFEAAALASKKYFKYLPAVENGVPVVRRGVTRRDVFDLP